MAILGTKNHEKRDGFNNDALRRKQFDKHYRKLELLITNRRPTDGKLTAEHALQRLNALGLQDKDFQELKQYRPVIYNHIAPLYEKKDAPAEPAVIETPAPAEPKRRGKNKITASLEETDGE